MPRTRTTIAPDITKNGEQWARIREMYEDGVPIAEIARKYAIQYRAIKKRAEYYGWQRPECKDHKMASGDVEHLVDVDEIEAMAMVGCTIAEISIIRGIPESILTHRYAHALKRGAANLRVRLRKAQIQAALGGDSAMLRWLGQQMLGQSDRREVKTEKAIKIVLADWQTKMEHDIAEIVDGEYRRVESDPKKPDG